MALATPAGLLDEELAGLLGEDDPQAADVLYGPAHRMERLFAVGEPSDEELLDRCWEAEAAVTQAMAEQVRLLAELRRRRLAQLERAEVGTAGADEDGWVTTEVAAALRLSERQVHARLGMATALQRYQVVRSIVECGLLGWWTAQRLTEHLDELAGYLAEDEVLEVEREAVGWLLAAPRSVTQLNARMRRVLLRARARARQRDGQDAEEPERRRHVDRRVSVRSEGDGMASLWALLPEADGLAVAAALDERARQSGRRDSRTLSQRRADLLVGAVTGMPAAYGGVGDLPAPPPNAGDAKTHGSAGGGVQVRLTVTVPVQSLLPRGSEPAEVPGYGPLPAASARMLAASPGVRVRPLVYDQDTGRLLGLGQYLPVTRWWAGQGSRVRWGAQITPVEQYAHPSLMDEFIRTRDLTCRAPGCTRAAARCDCDHITPYPDGPTSLANGCCLCRRHHRLKTHAPNWQVDTPEPDTLRWVTPTGTIVHTHPHDYRTPPDPGAADSPDPEADPPLY